MPNAKRNRRAPARHEPEIVRLQSCAMAVMRELAPLLSRLRPPRSRSTKHFRNAAIELLEAMRELIDETIEWLRKESRSEPELKRIRVEE